MAARDQFTIDLRGTFRLMGPDGRRIEITSRKGVALIAMLAMSHKGERTRAWLQEKLWGSRDQAQARGSLRRELSNLRSQLNTDALQLLTSKHDRVQLSLAHITVDARSDDSASDLDNSSGLVPADFLEGLDIPGEDGFEAWLREQRTALRDRTPASDASDSASQLPTRLLDVSQPMPGFAGRPALAVLPFRNLTGQSDLDYIAEGISEDLIDRLSKLRWLPVIARSSSFSLGGDVIDHQAVRARLGAKYLFEGRLRRSGAGFSLAVDLTDASLRQVLWTDRVEMPTILSEEAQARLAADLVGALDARIDHAEQLSARAKPQSDLNVSDLIWRGRWHFNRLTRDDAERARELFAQALALEPESPEALVHVTWALERSLWARRGSQAEIADMGRMARKVINIDGSDSRGYMLAGIAELWQRRPSRAETLLTQAIVLNPSLAGAHANLGSTFYLSGQPARALAPLQTALRLSPNDQEVFFVLAELAMTHSLLGDWAQAVDYAEQSVLRRRSYWYAHALKVNALVRGGDAGAARRALDDLLAAQPNFTDGYFDWVPFHDRAQAEPFKQGLALAAGL